ncbi:MAG: tRNA (adenosine(37)-N6)-threonylcarbamoyltransferase complex ATPase subunit type 1 TsaE [Phycisphaerales bacterium]
MRLGVRHHCDSPEATEALAGALAALLKPGDFVALRGELGAGKTRFVRGLARGLGHGAGAVSSPTFVLVHEYESTGFSGGTAGGAGRGKPTTLVHIDAYRLKGADDVDSIGWDELLESACVVAVEWPERVEARLPARRYEVFIDHAGENERDVTITRVEAAVARGSVVAPGVCRTCGMALDATAAGGAKGGAPFCSETCRMADLNKWFTGAYRVTRELKETDLEEGV